MELKEQSELYETTLERLNTCKGWWNVGDNYKKRKVYSCRDAVQFRDRLGSGETGVPLWTELKSQITEIIHFSTNRITYLIAHTRANTRFDQEKLLKILGFDAETVELNNIVDENILTKRDDCNQRDSPIFGLVNPLNVDKILYRLRGSIDSSIIIQIFDNSLFLQGGYPDTVMTNAGCRTKYLEIKPGNLVSCVKDYFDDVRLGDCSAPDSIWLGEEGKFVKDEWARFPPATGPKIGLLTGNSPESGLTLWNDFLDQYRNYSKNLADVLMPEVIVYSLPQMGLSMELVSREQDVWKEMKAAIIVLLKSGCKLITIACNTTIYFDSLIDNICKPYNAKFISIAEACLPEIQKRLGDNGKSSAAVGLVGIGPVIDVDGGYSGYAKQFKDNGVEVVACDATDLAWAIKRVGTSDNKDEIQSLVEKFRYLMSGPLSDVKIVVLSLTEVSLIYRKHIAKLPKKYKTKKTIIDPLFELSRYLVYLYILQGFRESKVCQIPEEFDLDSKLKKIIYQSKK